MGRLTLFCPFARSPVHPFGARAPLLADTAPPRRNAPQFCRTTASASASTLKPFFYLSHFSIRLSQQGKKIWPTYLCPRGPHRRPGPGASAQSLLPPVPARLAPSLGRSVPTANQNGNPCSLESVIAASARSWASLPLPAVLMEHGSTAQGISQAKGVRQLLG